MALGNIIKSKVTEPGGSLDAGKRGGADAARFLAAQVTLVVSPILWDKS